jgi:hypothetical protein
MGQIEIQSRFANLMTGGAFDLAWNQVRKEAWWNEPEKNADLDAAVDADMKDHKRKIGKNPENPTGNKTIQRVIDRVRGNPTPKKEATRKPAKLESETLRRLHEKVKKD